MSKENTVCEFCGLLIISSNYTKHLKTHNAKRENKCHLCQKEFTSKYNLQYHLAHHLNAREFLCSECPKSYNTAADLAQHKWTHRIPSDPFTCSFCGLQFQARNKFNAHMRTHEEPQGKKKSAPKGPKECPDCPGKTFQNLHEHRKVVHLGQRNFVCLICDKSFGKKSGLDRHKLTVHEKSREFKCDFQDCGKAFGERSLLQRHLRTHTEEYKKAKILKIYNQKPKNLNYCAFCNKTIENIKEHYETVHPDLENVCNFCHKRFKSLKILERHVKVFHEIERNFFCDFCPSKGFVEKYQLRRHLQTHLEKLEKIAARKSLKSETLESEDFNAQVQIWSDDEYPENSMRIEENRENSPIEEVLVKLEAFSDDGNSCPSHFIDEIEQQPEPNVIILENFSGKVEKNLENSENLLENSIENSIVRKMIKCRKCDELFDDLKAFNIHYSTSHPATPTATTCNFCHKTFAKIQFLKLHIQAIHEKNSFECEICGKKFSFERAKVRHVEVIHNNKRNYKCSHCQKDFGTSTQLKEHTNYYHSTEPLDKKTHYCTMCDKYFAQAKNLRQHHQSVHLGIKQKTPTEFKCKLCKEVFKNKYQKEKHHAQVHLNGKKLTRSCRICGSEFQFFEDFKNHIESHELPFICLICGINCDGQDAFNEHQANHRQVEVDLRQHECDICGHRCFKRLQIMIHMRKHMENSNAFVCDLCGAGYKYIAPFLYHKKAHEGKRDFICTFCAKGFISKQDLTVHIRSHTQEKPFKCSVCDRGFTSRAILTQHYQTHPETRKILSCTSCNLTFSDRKQAKTHDELFHPSRVPFKCITCGESFKLAHSLKSHVRHKHSEKDKDDFGTEIPMTEIKNGFYASNDFSFTC